MNEVLRQEKKFLLTQQQYYQLSHRLAQVLSMDAHSQGEGYMIRSLYFDSLDDRDFQEKEDGVELRRKIRLRCYDPNQDFAMLEMKQKQGAMQKKRSLRMRREDAQALIAGEQHVLLRYDDPFAAECFVIMQQHCYRPKAVVQYQRKAFVAKENKIRITFDHHIIASESCFDIFSPDLMLYSVMDPANVVLEVKYNGFLLSYIKDLLKGCDKSELSVGKYSMSRAISKHYQF